MKEYRIQADGGKELAISRWPDGKYSIKVFSSLGQMVAHLIVAARESERFSNAMREMATRDNPVAPPPQPTPGQKPMSDYL